ncbi:MAG: MFS transporter [Chloroflexi bacterium]|nr:MFS transporter [Chloroflexota bacterium]
MDTQQYKHLRHNFIVNIMDGGFFGFALGFASFTTVLPLFVSSLTSSAILIGLIPAIHSMGWQLPQLLTARQVSRLTHIKPSVLLLTIQERVPFLGLAVVAWFVPLIHRNLGLVLIYALLIWQGLGGGLAANGWQNMIAKVIPSENRATFFGLQSAAASLLAGAGAIAAGYILDRLPSPLDFSLCFIFASGMMVFSWFAMSWTKEPIQPATGLPQINSSLRKEVLSIIKRDRPFTWYLIARMLSQFGTMAFAFYTVYAVHHHGMSELAAGYLTGVLFITQVIANPVLGWLADRWSKKAALELGAVCGAFSALIAWLAPNVNWFFLVVILGGIASTSFWTIGLAYTMEFGTEADRPTYIGLANTLIAPSTILGPLLGGWAADAMGYSYTFIIAAGFCLVTAVVLHLIVKDVRTVDQEINFV